MAVVSVFVRRGRSKMVSISNRNALLSCVCHVGAAFDPLARRIAIIRTISFTKRLQIATTHVHKQQRVRVDECTNTAAKHVDIVTYVQHAWACASDSTRIA